MTFMTFTTFFTTTTTNIRYIRAFPPTPRQAASLPPPPARRKTTLLWAKMTIFRKKCAFYRLFSPFAPSFRPLPPFLPSLFSPPPPPSGKRYHILSTRVAMVYHNSVYVMRGLLSSSPALDTWRIQKWRENAPALRFTLSPNLTRGKCQNSIQAAFQAKIDKLSHFLPFRGKAARLASCPQWREMAYIRPLALFRRIETRSAASLPYGAIYGLFPLPPP